MQATRIQQTVLSALILAITATSALGDCYFRREVLSIGGLPIDDERESVVLQGDNTYECTYSFNVLVNGVWIRAERAAGHVNKTHACLAARDQAKTFVLTEVPNEYEVNVLQNTEMVCDTRKQERQLYVDIGQVVNLSDLIIDPRFIDPNGRIQLITPYDAPHMSCAIFLENVIRKDGVAIQNKGYACATGSAWTVWKKWEAARIDNSNG
jgi:hypothetical protein